MAESNLFGVAIPEAHSINELIDNKMNPAQADMVFPEDTPKYYCTLSFAEYVARTGSGGPIFNDPKSTGTVTLPLPLALIDKHTVRWDEKPLVGLNLALDLGAAVIGTRLAGAIAGVISDVATPASALTGLAPNWFQTIMFDRPEYKRMELQFKLSPRNYNESLSIREIITFINNRMSPTITFGQALWEFPDIVKVLFKPNSKFLYKFKPAVIETMAVNYVGGGGQKAFYHNQVNGGDGDNPPESVEITLNLIEVEYWKRYDFTNQNDSG